jgi:hypothetical protein
MDRIPEPTNDHERTIAGAIESKLASNNSYESIVAEVVVSVPFDMSIADTQFLLNYAHWRLALPAKKEPTGGAVPNDLNRSG